MSNARMRRLPRPGEVAEHCRLCAAVLVLTVENPRRVCANCGEINLPNDPVKVSSSAPLVAAARPSISEGEFSHFIWSAAAPVFLRDGRRDPRLADWRLQARPLATTRGGVLAGFVATLVSFSRAVWGMTKDGARLGVITMLWASGPAWAGWSASSLTWVGALLGLR